MEPFGIPDGIAKAQAIQQAVGGNAELLQHIGIALVVPIGEAAERNEAALNLAASAIKRQLGNRVGANRKSLNAIADHSAQVINASVQANRHTLAEFQSAATPGMERAEPSASAPPNVVAPSPLSGGVILPLPTVLHAPPATAPPQPTLGSGNGPEFRTDPTQFAKCQSAWANAVASIPAWDGVTGTEAEAWGCGPNTCGKTFNHGCEAIIGTWPQSNPYGSDALSLPLLHCNQIQPFIDALKANGFSVITYWTKPVQCGSAAPASPCPPGWPGIPPDGFCNCWVNEGWQVTTPDNCAASGGTCWYDCPDQPPPPPPPPLPPPTPISPPPPTPISTPCPQCACCPCQCHAEKPSSPPTQTCTNAGPPLAGNPDARWTVSGWATRGVFGAEPRDEDIADVCENAVGNLAYKQWCETPSTQSVEDSLNSVTLGFGLTGGQFLDTSKLPFGTQWVGDIFNWLGGLAINIATSGNCSDARLVPLVSYQTIVGLIEKWIGTPLPAARETLQYYVNWLCPYKIPDEATLLEAFLSGKLGDEPYHEWMNAHGYCDTTVDLMTQARREKLMPHERIEWMRRHFQSDEQIGAALANYGFVDEVERGARIELSYPLPTIGDFLQWLQRNVYDKEYVERYRLLEGFDNRFWATFGEDLHSIGMKKEYAKYHYAAHWINPAPGQMQEMVFRLRPTKAGVKNPFTVEDYGRILAEQDVAPYFQSRFSEIVYNVPALGYLRDMYRQGIIDDEALKGYHQDLGYTETDSARFVEIDAIVKRRTRASESHGWTTSAIAKAFISGYLSSRQVDDEMDKLGFTELESEMLKDRAQGDLQYTSFTRARTRALSSVLADVKTGINAGVLDTQTAVASLVATGWPQSYAVGFVSAVNHTAMVDLVKQSTSRLRSTFLAGEITLDDAALLLGQLGLVQSAIQTILTAWAISFTPKRKRRSAAQVQSDFQLGLLTQAQAEMMLHNLGFDHTDILLFIRNARLKMAEAESKQKATELRQEKQAAKDLQTIIRTQQQQLKEAQAALRTISPVSKLQKWVKLGIVAEDFFFNRLKDMGYDAADASRYWQETQPQTNG